MIEKFEKSIDKGHLTNLSKAFDCIDYKLLITKLYWYGISLSSINLLSSYLNNRTQRIKLNNCFSLRHQIEYGVKVSQLNPVRWKHCWEFHISNICRKVSRRLSALGRIAGYITLENVGCCPRHLLNLNLITAH